MNYKVGDIDRKKTESDPFFLVLTILTFSIVAFIIFSYISFFGISPL